MKGTTLRIIERAYVMYSPFVMVLGNLISGVLFLLDEYTTSVHDYLSILTGCSLIFFPQFVCNIIRYKLCIYYKLTITFLFLNLVLGLLYQAGIMVLTIRTLRVQSTFITRQCRSYSIAKGIKILSIRRVDE